MLAEVPILGLLVVYLCTIIQIDIRHQACYTSLVHRERDVIMVVALLKVLAQDPVRYRWTLPFAAHFRHVLEICLHM